MVQCFIENRKKKSHDIVCCFFVDIQNLVIKICSLFIPCFKSGVEEKLSRQSGLAVKIIRGGPWRRKPKKITTRLSKENEAMRRRDAQVSEYGSIFHPALYHSATRELTCIFVFTSKKTVRVGLESKLKIVLLYGPVGRCKLWSCFTKACVTK